MCDIARTSAYTTIQSVQHETNGRANRARVQPRARGFRLHCHPGLHIEPRPPARARTHVVAQFRGARNARVRRLGGCTGPSPAMLPRPHATWSCSNGFGLCSSAISVGAAAMATAVCSVTEAAMLVMHHAACSWWLWSDSRYNNMSIALLHWRNAATDVSPCASNCLSDFHAAGVANVLDRNPFTRSLMSSTVAGTRTAVVPAAAVPLASAPPGGTAAAAAAAVGANAPVDAVCVVGVGAAAATLAVTIRTSSSVSCRTLFIARCAERRSIRASCPSASRLFRLVSRTTDDLGRNDRSSLRRRPVEWWQVCVWGG